MTYIKATYLGLIATTVGCGMQSSSDQVVQNPPQVVQTSQVIANDSIERLANQRSELLFTFKQGVLQGDTVSYRRLRYEYLNYPPDEFFAWSYVMAEKYQVGEAYFDLYASYCLMCGCSDYRLECLSGEDKVIARGFLTKAARLGSEDAREALRE